MVDQIDDWQEVPIGSQINDWQEIPIGEPIATPAIPPEQPTDMLRTGYRGVMENVAKPINQAIGAATEFALSPITPMAQATASGIDSTGAGQWIGDRLMGASNVVSDFVKPYIDDAKDLANYNPDLAKDFEAFSQNAQFAGNFPIVAGVGKGLAKAGEKAIASDIGGKLPSILGDTGSGVSTSTALGGIPSIGERYILPADKLAERSILKTIKKQGLSPEKLAIGADYRTVAEAVNNPDLNLAAQEAIKGSTLKSQQARDFVAARPADIKAQLQEVAKPMLDQLKTAGDQMGFVVKNAPETPIDTSSIRNSLAFELSKKNISSPRYNTLKKISQYYENENTPNLKPYERLHQLKQDIDDIKPMAGEISYDKKLATQYYNRINDILTNKPIEKIIDGKTVITRPLPDDYIPFSDLYTKANKDFAQNLAGRDIEAAIKEASNIGNEPTQIGSILRKIANSDEDRFNLLQSTPDELKLALENHLNALEAVNKQGLKSTVIGENDKGLNVPTKYGMMKQGLGVLTRQNAINAAKQNIAATPISKSFLARFAQNKDVKYSPIDYTQDRVSAMGKKFASGLDKKAKQLALPNYSKGEIPKTNIGDDIGGGRYERAATTNPQTYAQRLEETKLANAQKLAGQEVDRQLQGASTELPREISNLTGKPISNNEIALNKMGVPEIDKSYNNPDGSLYVAKGNEALADALNPDYKAQVNAIKVKDAADLKNAIDKRVMPDIMAKVAETKKAREAAEAAKPPKLIGYKPSDIYVTPRGEAGKSLDEMNALATSIEPPAKNINVNQMPSESYAANRKMLNDAKDSTITKDTDAPLLKQNFDQSTSNINDLTNQLKDRMQKMSFIKEVQDYINYNSKLDKKATIADKFPVSNFLAKNGGIIIQKGEGFGDLKALGLPKIRGLFVTEKQKRFMPKGKNKTGIDNIPVEEWKKVFNDNPISENGYVDRDYILDAVSKEASGKPITKVNSEMDDFIRQYEQSGLNFNASPKEVHDNWVKLEAEHKIQNIQDAIDAEEAMLKEQSEGLLDAPFKKGGLVKPKFLDRFKKKTKT